MDLLIEFFGSSTLFLNKVLLYLDRKKSGWICGIIGILTLCWPIYQKHLWINLVYHIGLALLMLYGYILASGLENRLSKSWNLRIRFLLSLLTLGLSVYLYIQTKNSRNFNEIQLLQGVTGLTAALLIAFNSRTTNLIGWFLNIASHCFAIKLMIEKNLYFVTFFQILSVIVAVLAIKKEFRTKASS